jgi:predicted O-methyltransferase YrrM
MMCTCSTSREAIFEKIRALHFTFRWSGLPLPTCRGEHDLIYADAWPGKFTDLDQALALLRIGGIYFIDDLLPQSNWPEGMHRKCPP